MMTQIKPISPKFYRELRSYSDYVEDMKETIGIWKTYGLKSLHKAGYASLPFKGYWYLIPLSDLQAYSDTWVAKRALIGGYAHYTDHGYIARHWLMEYYHRLGRVYYSPLDTKHVLYKMPEL